MPPISSNLLGDNAQVPGAYSAHYTPDQLIADSRTLVSDPILLGAGTYKRGAVLGQQTVYPIIGAVGPANTGNGVLSALSTTKTSQIGVYTLTATDATDFALVDPQSNALGHVTVGTPFAGEIGLTLTAGATAFVAGDSFTLSVADAVGVFVSCVKTAVDGSADPVAILADDVTATSVVSTGAYVAGEFNAAALTYDAGWNPALLFAGLRKVGIHAKASVTASAPLNNSAP
jgi:hypothetical protein